MRKTLFLAVAISVCVSLIGMPVQAAFSLPATTTSMPTEPDPGVVKSAVNDFNALSKKEKRKKVKEVKKQIKAFKKDQKAGKEPSTNTLLLVILAILLPPLAVYLHQGEINTKFWISLILTLLFWLPGVIYSLIVVLGNA